MSRGVLACFVIAIALRGGAGQDGERERRPVASIKRTLGLEGQLALFCNVSGPCLPCSDDEAGREAKPAAETNQCRVTGFRQELQCLVEADDSDLKHQVRRSSHDALKPGTRVTSFQPCHTGHHMTLATFELIVVVLATIAAPIVVWKKRRRAPLL